ncbi:MAG: hypothetical protein KKF41_05305 [Actinobacteria bacterium]|nr:hypothetical protein [Actinomycetota bacterium]MBU1942559.1 hypothetical protein [Actinomycetota bacterium]MBU2686985.1 hypothetical protein [Actinomycetota bacterium]
MDDSHVWAVGYDGVILFYDGAMWARQDSGTSVWLEDVWGYDPDHVWAVGPNGVILFFDGSQWRPQSVATTDSFHAVTGLDSTHVWASSGSYGEIAFFNGSTWTVQDCGGSYMNDISAYSASNVWTVGGNADVIRYDGTGWSDVSLPPEMGGHAYWGVKVIDPSHIWVVGASDVPHLYNGSTWTTFTDVESGHWRDVEATGVNDVWFVFLDKVYHYDGSSWSQVGDEFSKWIEDISLLSDGSAWVAGSEGGVYQWGGQTPGPPAPQSSRTWYFAEGSTNGGFETWILVQNPGDQNTDVNLTYMTDAGEVQGPSAVIPPESRTTFNVADTVPNTWEVSTRVEADGNVIAERTMFWGNRVGGHNTVGVNEPHYSWCLAEGANKGGFETWILVQNPTDSVAAVEVFFSTSGDYFYEGPSWALAPHSRETYFMGDWVPEEWEVSTLVESDVPIIAERSMYWSNRSAGHNSIGAPYASTGWLLAEGCTRGGFETWVLVDNPFHDEVEVELTYLTGHGPVTGPKVVLPPYSRESFNVADTVPEEWGVSTVVSSSYYVVAERAVYWNNRKGGHDSLGVPAPSEKWYVAEGSTKGGFETWVLVQNPWNEDTEVTLSFMTPTGRRKGPTVNIEAASRMTFFVADSVPDEWEVSTVVEADRPVVVEKAIYWGNRIEGGCSQSVPDS